MEAQTLTPRQAQVVELHAQGMTGKEVARELGVAVGTAQNILAQARERIGAKTVAHLVAISISKGFIQTLCLALTLAMLVGADDGIRNRVKQRVVRRHEVVAIYA